MNYIKISIVVISFIEILLMACTAQQDPSTKETTPVQKKEVEGERETLKAAWEIEWEKTLQAARKEGKVVVYGSAITPSLVRAADQAGFSKKYGFIPEFVTARGAEITARMLNERRAGLFIPSVSISGMNSFIGEMKPAKIPAPLERALILPEVVDPKYWYGGKLRWGDADHSIFLPFAFTTINLIINKELVKAEEVRAYRDLLNPKWKGKILMSDPTLAGTALKGFGILGFNILDLEFFRQLAKQEPVILRDERLLVDWVAKGKYAILLFPHHQSTVDYIQAGAPLDYVIPAEGSYVTAGGSGAVLMSRAPQPNAARIFINWYLSQEGQTLVSRNWDSQSARIDVSTEGLTPERLMKPGVKYFLDGDTEEWISRDLEFKKAALEILGPLMK